MKKLTFSQKLELGAHLICLAPLLVVFAVALLTLFGATSTLGFVSATAFLTDAAMIAFTAMLAMTPITIFTGWRWPQILKRPLGLYAFAYSGIHFLMFAGGFNFDPLATTSGAFANAMLVTGAMALLGMTPLALTSNRWSMKRLGRNWKRLHWLVYPISLSIIAHLFFLGEALPWAILYSILLIVRIPTIRSIIVSWRTGDRRSIRATA